MIGPEPKPEWYQTPEDTAEERAKIQKAFEARQAARREQERENS
tara:strand:+ start:290 stop:421 length:132 start_codon:yes stop_codon:yes gene_type:complete